MAELIVIGYPDETKAEAAAAEIGKLAEDLVIEPEAVAVIKRDPDGKFHVTTTHHEVSAGAMWGMFWGALFGLLFFVPLFGMAIGAALGALTGLVTKLGLSSQFQQQVRDLLQPGTSALFMIVNKMTTDRTVQALSRYGGTVLKSSLSADVEREIQEALHGSDQTVAASTDGSRS
jgi:uncharacterized membrane protein